MDLTNEDVTDILALLDSLPYDELDLQTPRFRLTLRRTPAGWTQAVEARATPTVVDVPLAGRVAGAAGGAPGAAGGAPGAAGDAPGAAGGAAGAAGGAAAPGALGGVPMASGGHSTAAATAPATDPMVHRGGYNRSDGPSGRLESEAGEAGGVDGIAEVSTGATGPGVGGDDAGHGVIEADASLVAVRAPLPGTFYRAPRPGTAPFVEVGSRVGADTVVGIVETMKLFNSVTAGTAGTVAEICLGNGEFADRGATLLSIRAD